MKLIRSLCRSSKGRCMTLGEVEAFCRDAREQGFSDEASVWDSIWLERNHIQSDHAITSLTVSEKGRQYGVSK